MKKTKKKKRLFFLLKKCGNSQVLVRDTVSVEWSRLLNCAADYYLESSAAAANQRVADVNCFDLNYRLLLLLQESSFSSKIDNSANIMAYLAKGNPYAMNMGVGMGPVGLHHHHSQGGLGHVGGGGMPGLAGLAMPPSAMDPLHSAVGFPPGMDRPCKYEFNFISRLFFVSKMESIL